MSTLRLILGDQLSESLASLKDAQKHDTIMLCEVAMEATYVKHHPKKIAFLFCAMRHFADSLARQGFRIRYIILDDSKNTGSLDGELKRAIQDINPENIVLTEPGEWRVLKMMRTWQDTLPIPVTIHRDNRFLCSRALFSAWITEHPRSRMEYFYRDMRKKYALLIEKDGRPTGGQWNYDKQNRKPPKKGASSPKRISHKKSSITQDVLALVEKRFKHHFGNLKPFHYAVTREQALLELDHFIENLLPQFGDYQDAMVAGEAYLYHSLLSTYLNAGLLLPLEICQKAEAAYRSGHAPLNAAEGFIRQILGWREYMRGIYWHHMPAYGSMNYLEAKTPLPSMYWTAETHMACMREAITHTRDHAYSHHIQRLMVTGNFALIAGLDVAEVQEWYLAVYSDAYEWVEMPNTLGMALFGDGGIIGSKPYAASGKYIHRMSNFCQQCRYDPDEMTGDTACPFNALYWDFLARNESKLRYNQRIPYVFSTWDNFAPTKKEAIRSKAKQTLAKMAAGTL